MVSMCVAVVHKAVPHALRDVGVLWYDSIPPLHPTTTDLGVLWVWWVWVGLEVNMTVMRPSMVIYRPGMVQTDGRSYPQVRAAENTRKHHHMTGNRSTKHPHCGALCVIRACGWGSESTDM